MPDAEHRAMVLVNPGQLRRALPPKPSERSVNEIVLAANAFKPVSSRVQIKARQAAHKLLLDKSSHRGLVLTEGQRGGVLGRGLG